MNAEQLRASIRELAAAAQQSAGQHYGQDDGGLWDMAASLMQVADAPQQIGRDVPDEQRMRNLLARYENQWHRMGELWERCQGKGWPEAESKEFARLRDELTPATRALLLACAQPAPQQIVHGEPVATLTMFDMRSQTGTVDLVGGWKELRVGDPLYTHPAPQQKPLTDEQDRALCEAYCNAASDEYFKARPQLDSSANRRIFYAGHRKAWIEWQAAHNIGEVK